MSAIEDIAVQGLAKEDDDFNETGDKIRYSTRVDRSQGPFTVEAQLIYQPIAFRWAKNLKQQPSEEGDRFVSYFDSMSTQSWIVLATDVQKVR